MFDREKIIEELVQDDLLYIKEDGHQAYIVAMIERYLREGFKGYENFSEEELIQECEDRDISYLFGDND